MNKIDIFDPTISRFKNLEGFKTLIKAGCQAIPIVGSSFSELLNGLEKIHQYEFFQKINSGLIEVNEETIQTNEFLFFFVTTMNSVQKTMRKEKIRMFGSMVLHAIRDKDFLSRLLIYEEILKILDELSILELAILREIDNYILTKGHPFPHDKSKVYTREDLKISDWQNLFYLLDNHFN